MKRYVANNLNDTKYLASSFVNLLKTGDIIALNGTLGVGKTEFVRSLIQSLKQKEEVPSPTFTLLQTYDMPNFDLYHFDLYRLEKPEDVYELGIEDAFSYGVTLIEWPIKMGKILPQSKVLTIDISISENGSRVFDFSSTNTSWTERLTKWNI